LSSSVKRKKCGLNRKQSKFERNRLVATNSPNLDYSVA
jgi:hypothetical protein